MLKFFNQVIAPANSELSKCLGITFIEVKYVPSVSLIHVETPEYEEDSEESPREEALRDLEDDFFNYH